jgi:hypothetical protein
MRHKEKKERIDIKRKKEKELAACKALVIYKYALIKYKL